MGIEAVPTEGQLEVIPTFMFSPVGFVEEPVIDKLQVGFAQIVERISKQLDEITVRVISAPTTVEFQRIREALFPSYVNLHMALGNTVVATIDLDELPILADASFNDLQAEFRSTGAAYFGEDAASELLFSLATLQSAYRLVPQLLTRPLGESDRRDDVELARKFTWAAIWSSFHLRGLRTALQRGSPITREVVHELLDGLRLSVMAYSYVRAALDLRKGLDVRYEEPVAAIWDAEDEALARSE